MSLKQSTSKYQSEELVAYAERTASPNTCGDLLSATNVASVTEDSNNEEIRKDCDIEVLSHSAFGSKIECTRTSDTSFPCCLANPYTGSGLKGDSGKGSKDVLSTNFKVLLDASNCQHSETAIESVTEANDMQLTQAMKVDCEESPCFSTVKKMKLDSVSSNTVET